jgi:hypothetical protein
MVLSRLLPPWLLVSLRLVRHTRLDAESRHDYYGGGDKPRDYSPTRDRSGSSALYASQCVLPIPFRLVIEAACAIIEHKEHRNTQIPRRDYITPMPTIDASTIY